jgi:hypothetical protein
MGTLTTSNGKPQGPADRTTQSANCRWCGDRLVRAWPDSAGVGYAENGFFCSLRCGFQWAALQFGVRYG